MFKFVEATKDDLTLLSNLRRKVWDETYRGIYYDSLIDDYDYEYNMAKDLKRINNKDYKVFIFYLDNTPIGYGYFGIEDKIIYRDLNVYIAGLYVIKKHKHYGIGKKFFNEVIDFCKKRNINKFYNCCNLHNYPAQGFYEHMGGYIGRVDFFGVDKRNHQIFYEYNIKS